MVKRVIKELENLTDISERESHKLAALCGLLFECEDQFDLAGPLVETTMGDDYNDEVGGASIYADGSIFCGLVHR